MGSGSSRGGGSGSGGSGTGSGSGSYYGPGSSSSSTTSAPGSTWAAGLGYLFKRAGLVENVIGKDAARNSINEILKRVHRGNLQYFEKQFHGPVILGIYEALFQLSGCLRENNKADRLACLKALGIGGERGALKAWTGDLLERLKCEEPDQRIYYTARAIIDDVLTRIVKDDPAVYLEANAATFMEQADPAVLARLSNHTLTLLIWNVIAREKERPRGSVESQLIQECANLANSVIDAFEGKFDRRFPELLSIASQNQTWFFQTLTQ